MDDALRQFAWPVLFQHVQLFDDFIAEARPYAVAARTGMLIERPPVVDGQCVRALHLEIRAREVQPCQRFTHSGAVTGVWPPDPQAIEECDNRRRAAGNLAKHPALLVLDRLRTSDAAR